jgi:putative sigma-54 modulation protein
MHTSFTFRNFEVSETAQDYAREKIERIRKYFPDPIKAHITFLQVRGYLFSVDVQLTLHNGLVVKAEEQTEDLHSSTDLVMAKIERQLRRYKDRIRDHKPLHGPHRSVRHMVVSYGQKQTEAAVPGTKKPEAQPVAVENTTAHQIIREEKFVAQPMTVDEAIMRMNLRHEEFLVFNNIATHEVNVVYRRGNETYGLIETTHDAAAAGDKPTEAAHS